MLSILFTPLEHVHYSALFRNTVKTSNLLLKGQHHRARRMKILDVPRTNMCLTNFGL